MGSKKEKKPSIQDLARKRITNLYMYEGKELLLFCAAAIKGKSLNVFAALDSTGITLYEYKETYENKVIKLETHSWDEWDEVLIDHYFVKSTLNFTGVNGSWSVSIDTDGKEVQQVINSYTNIKIEVASRPWHRKIVGFRSRKTWKMITATLIYAILIFSIIDINTSDKTDDTLATVAMILTFLAFLGLLIGLIKPKYALPFTPNKQRKKVGKIYGTSILLAFLMMLIFIPVQANVDGQIPEMVKSEKLPKEKDPIEIDTALVVDVDNEDKNVNEQNKDNQDKDNKNKEADKKANQPVTSTPNNPKTEEEPKSPSGVALTSAVVTRVVDGDTLKVNIDGKEETIRMILVDTPETKHPRLGVQPFGPEASAFTENALNGKKIGLEKDVSDRDQYGRLLRYVWVDGKLFNQQLIEKGLARVAVYQPDVKYVDQFRASQQKAQEEGIGIWSIENYAQEDGYNTQEEKPEEKPATIKAPEPQPKEDKTTNSGSCNIKGNISSSGEKIYHVPGGQFYEVTNSEQTFCSTAEAETAGYRASKR